MPDQDPLSGDRDLITTLTAAALDRAAPEELLVLDETGAESFADPGALLNPKNRDEPVGFGIEIGLLAPYVLAIATPVVKFLLDTMASAAQDAGEAGADPRGAAPDPVGPPSPDGDKAVALTVDQVRRARAIAYEQARRLGLAEGQSALLADSVAGGLVSGS